MQLKNNPGITKSLENLVILRRFEHSFDVLPEKKLFLRKNV